MSEPAPDWIESILRSGRFQLFSLASQILQFTGGLSSLSAPIFIVGVPRSGTRLLEKLLLTSGSLSSWSEGNHVWEPDYYHFWNLNRTRTGIPGFTGRGIHAHEIPESRQKSLKPRVRRLFSFYTQLQGKRLLHRNPFNSMRVRLLKEWFEAPRIIHIFRDARAAVNSYVTKYRDDDSHDPRDLVEQAVYRWKTCFNRVRDFVEKNPSCSVEIKYSELSSKRQKQVLENLFEFCGLSCSGSPWESIVVENRNTKWKKKLEPDFVEFVNERVDNPIPEPIRPDSWGH